MGIPFDALYGAGDAAAAPAIVYRQEWLIVEATEGTKSGTLLAPDVSRRLAIAQVRMAATGYGTFYPALRGFAYAGLSSGRSGPDLARLVISPERPSDTMSLAPLPILLPPGEGITYEVWTQFGAGNAGISLVVAYYLAEVT